jgi:hypothetical protein
VEPVSARAWSELLHAEVGTLLRLAGVPCLHIKGPTVATWLYDEGERSWGDVDILVSPGRMDDALEVLIESGFAYRDRGLRWRTSEDHALTLWQNPASSHAQGGPAEVDVHHRFEGIEGDPERAFEELWRRREPATMAHLDVWFPDLTTRALLVVLNVARDPGSGRAREDLRRLLASGDDRDWQRAISLATRLDALESLRAGLELDPAGQDLVARTSLADVTISATTRLRAQGSSRTALRLEELRQLGPAAKVKAVAAWVVPSPAVIRYRDPTAAGSTWRLARAYAVRYRDGARGLRRSIREVREVRRRP